MTAGEEGRITKSAAAIASSMTFGCPGGVSIRTYAALVFRGPRFKRAWFTISTSNGSGWPASAACSAHSVAYPWGSAYHTTTSRIPARAVAMHVVEDVLAV